MTDFNDPVDSTVFLSADGIKYWKAYWLTNDTVGSAFAYWGEKLQAELAGRAVIIDTVVVGSKTTAAETYNLGLYQGATSGEFIFTPSQSTQAGILEYKQFDGPYGPLLVDTRLNSYAFWLYGFWGAFTAGDDFSVNMCGRALPKYTDPAIEVHTQPVSVEGYKWPLTRRY